MELMIMQMAPMWVLAGCSAGWLAEAFSSKDGYGLMIDLGLGLTGAIAGGWTMQSTGVEVGMPGALLTGLLTGSVVILAQRLVWKRPHGGADPRPRSSSPLGSDAARGDAR